MQLSFFYKLVKLSDALSIRIKNGPKKSLVFMSKILVALFPICLEIKGAFSQRRFDLDTLL